MSKMARRLTLGAALAGGCALALMAACESVPLTAAPGTTMTLIANPTFVPANGGVSVVTAILVEPAGTFVPDGTEVLFFTNLGRVDPRGKTVDGVARVNFVSDARSGTATVTANSGGPAPAPSASATATTGGPSVIGVTASDAGLTAVAAGSSAAGTGENSASVDITIGSALPDHVVVTASPPLLASARQATITANVFDKVGNPVQNVPVIFSVAAAGTAPLQEFLDSGGAPQYTDSNGQAFDTLRTRAPSGTTQKTVTVTATTANGISESVSVAVNYVPAR